MNPPTRRPAGRFPASTGGPSSAAHPRRARFGRDWPALELIAQVAQEAAEAIEAEQDEAECRRAVAQRRLVFSDDGQGGVLFKGGVAPAVMAGPSRVLDHGREARTAPPALRQASELPDGGCALPKCDIPVEGTDAHHVNAF